MKTLLFLLGVWLYPLLILAQPGKNQLAIIPQPVSLSTQSGTFSLPQTVVIQAPARAELNPVTAYLKNRLVRATGYRVETKSSAAKPAITLTLNAKEKRDLGPEGYELFVTKNGIHLGANQPAGLFYGVQTLLQLMPKAIENSAVVPHQTWTVPLVTIRDYPRFGWRGIMLDVARHFFTKEEVKQYMDELARYKFNLLHLHLSDDQGWRLEIKSLPRLTSVGARPATRLGATSKFRTPRTDESGSSPAYYTQDDIKELVQYGKERFINIMPELDVPGHSLAAILAYPELSTAADSLKRRLRSGGEVVDFFQLGNAIDPSRESTYAFLNQVISEVAALFPFPYLHLGGDECLKMFWAKSDSVKALMQKQGLTNLDQVQGYFEKRVEQMVVAKGKQFMGWDEIPEGGLGPTAAVMSWRGTTGAVTASKLGHSVVVSPTTFAYLDYMQGDRSVEPPLFATLRLNQAYQFDPAPDSVDARFILGGQGNLWTEQIATFRQVEYMTWPRGLAIAESVWSPRETKNWNGFYPRVEQHLARLAEAEIKYAPSMYDPDFAVSQGADSLLRVSLTTELPDLDLYYSLDSSYPDRFSARYSQPLIIPSDTKQLRVISYRGKAPLGRMITLAVAELKSRVAQRSEKP